MFAAIYRLGAGLGPASAFLYSGPAINVLAIFLTARVLGLEPDAARAVGAVGFAFVVGLVTATVFRKEERAKAEAALQLPLPPPARRSVWKNGAFLAAMVGFLVFSDWFNPGDAIRELRGRLRDPTSRPPGDARRDRDPNAHGKREDRDLLRVGRRACDPRRSPLWYVF